MTGPIQWRHASARGGDAQNSFIEVAFGASGVVLMRASDEPEEIMYFPAAEWNAFIDAIRAGEFEHHSDPGLQE